MMKRCFAAILPLLLASLTGCSTSGAPPSPTIAPTEQGGAPSATPGSSTIDMQPFVEMAVQADCARDQNRLLVIDDKMVLWERRDLHCADASYEIRLLGTSADAILCRNYDSIAGPMRSCEDEKLLPVFETIIGHLEEADLGLGSDHTVMLAWQAQ